MSSVRLIARGAHPFIGRYVIVEFRTVEGSGGRYRETWTRSLFPEEQGHLQAHHRHPSGFCVETGIRNACVSPSCSFYGDLCRYGNFRWRPQA